MRPPKRSTVDYERVKAYDEWLPGVIQDVQLEENRKSGFKNEDGSEQIKDMIRFKFALDGHSFPHRSRWMSYTFGEKSNLYLKYLKYLVEGAQPDMKFDLDLLKGFKVKTMWSENGDFDNLEQVRPLASKCPATGNPLESEPDPDEGAGQSDPEVGF